MTTTGKPPSARRSGRLGQALASELGPLQKQYLAESSRAKATLAGLRRGLGKPAGSVPEIWDITIGPVPEDLQGRDRPGEPGASPAEQAAHAAMTLYALHQQSLSKPAHVPGVSFGRSVAHLRGADQRSEEAVTRRFMAVATAQSAEEAMWHMRGLITQLRTAQIGLDYALLADDLFALLTPSRANRVRLAWGRDYYRTIDSDSGTESVPATESDTGE